MEKVRDDTVTVQYTTPPYIPFHSRDCCPALTQAYNFGAEAHLGALLRLH